jgi:hypothetical protein
MLDRLFEGPAFFDFCKPNGAKACCTEINQGSAASIQKKTLILEISKGKVFFFSFQTMLYSLQ